MNTNLLALPLFSVWTLLASAGSAQDLGFSSVVVERPITLSVAPAGGVSQTATVQAGSDVSGGLACDTAIPGAIASVLGMFDVNSQYQSLQIEVTSSVTVNGAVQPNGGSSTGNIVLTVHLEVPRPMPVSFDVRVVAFDPFGGAGVGTATLSYARVAVVRGDGVVLDVVAKANAEDPLQEQTVLELPAGTVDLRIELRAEVPPNTSGADCTFAFASAQLSIQPAHVTVDYQGATCGAGIFVRPLLDGDRVACTVGAASGASAWLALGLLPVDALLPFPPMCSLLVDPIVLLPMPASGTMPLSVAPFGPVTLQVQGLALSSISPWWSTEVGLVSSPRAVLHVR